MQWTGTPPCCDVSTCTAETKRVTGMDMLLVGDSCDLVYLLRADGCNPLQVDMAGIDILLVGDSVGMVVHGHDTTLPVTLEDILVHCKAVFRGTRRCGTLLTCSAPFALATSCL